MAVEGEATEAVLRFLRDTRVGCISIRSKPPEEGVDGNGSDGGGTGRAGRVGRVSREHIFVLKQLGDLVDCQGQSRHG